MSAPVCKSVGRAYRGSDGAVTCCECDSECEWGPCREGCDDGYFDGYDEDPLWYDHGDLVPCHMCGGQGGDWWCTNSKCKNSIVILQARAATGGSTP